MESGNIDELEKVDQKQHFGSEDIFAKVGGERGQEVVRNVEVLEHSDYQSQKLQDQNQNRQI